MTMTQRYAGMLRRHAGEMDAAGHPPVKAEEIRRAARHMEDLERTLSACAWKPMMSAPKDGTVVLVLLDGSDYGHPAYWLTGPDSPRAVEDDDGTPGWRMAWDASRIEVHDGPRYWMASPMDPDGNADENA